MHPARLIRKGFLALTLLFLFPLCSEAVAAQGAAAACPNDLGSPINNFCVVTPQVLWRGARPDRDGAAWLIRQGVRTIVNLELILDDRATFGQATVTDGKTYEADYFRIPDWEPLPLLAPSVVDDHVAHFLAIVSRQAKPVYVHCRSGMNRTGVMVAAYRVLGEGVGAEKAIEEMGRYQGQWFKADARYIRGLLPERRAEVRRKVAEWLPKLKGEARIMCANGRCAVSDRGFEPKGSVPAPRADQDR